MADKYEMGEMPESPELEGEELAMEGDEYGSPDEEVSPVEDLKSRLVELDKDGLKELEAAIADELSKQEEGEEEPAEEPAEEAPEESEAPDAGGDLSSMFG